MGRRRVAHSVVVFFPGEVSLFSPNMRSSFLENLEGDVERGGGFHLEVGKTLVRGYNFRANFGSVVRDRE